jgi:hypothetical protein
MKGRIASKKASRYRHVFADTVQRTDGRRKEILATGCSNEVIDRDRRPVRIDQHQGIGRLSNDRILTRIARQFRRNRYGRRTPP